MQQIKSWKLAKRGYMWTFMISKHWKGEISYRFALVWNSFNLLLISYPSTLEHIFGKYLDKVLLLTLTA